MLYYRWMIRSLALILVVFNVVFFFNCSRTSFKSNGDGSQEYPQYGGGGIDGKMYYSYGTCIPSQINIVASVTVADDFKAAWMTREDCQNLATPKSVDVAQIKIAAEDNSSLMLDGRVYSIDAFTDGKQKAPITSIPYPTLLAGYVLRPVWSVAGVDYPVGVAAGAVLKDPATIAMAGVTVNNGSRTVIVTANDVVLDGYDFTRNGGWSVRINGAANTRIVRSHFIETASQGQAPISTDAAATNLYVGYSTIDGGGAGSNPVQGALIGMSGRGFIAEYNWLKNAPSNIFEFGYGGGGGGSVLIRFNLIEDSGRAGGGGGSYLMMSAGAYTNIQIVFNTSYQTPGQTGATGWNIDPSAGVLTSEIGNNVMITTAPGAASYLTSIGTNTGAAVVHDNYFDLRGAFGFAYPGASASYSVYSDNFNMTNGQTLPTNP